MASPLATEKVLRGVLQSLQRGGVISSGSDVSKLEQIPNNATDQDISDILDTITFGGVSAATDVIRGDGDVNVFVDANNDDSPLVTQRYFRVAEDQSDPPVTDAGNELATISQRADGPTFRTAELIVGPRTSLAGAKYNGSIKLGTDSSDHFGGLLGGFTAVGNALPGVRLDSPTSVGVQADTNVQVTDQAGTSLRGGWSDMTSATRFHVGDYLATPNPESLAIERNSLGAGVYTYTIRPTHDGSSVRRLYIRGSNAASSYYSQTIVGGKAGETWGDPSNLGNATFAAVGDDANTNASCAYFYDRKSSRSPGTAAVVMQCNTAAGGGFYYLRVLDSAGGGVFNIDSNGNANLDSGKSYQTAGADVAELVVADAEYDPGTVLCLQQGQFTKSTDVGQTSVAGVVATQPGVVLGTANDYDRSREFQLRVQTDNLGQTDCLKVRGDVADSVGQYIRTHRNHFVKIVRVVDHQDSADLYLQERIVVYEGMHCFGGITKQNNLNRMAITGIVPVMCSTAQGDIQGNGEFLVSGPDGCAVVDYEPKPGTIIGKAKGTLLGEGKTVKGLVEALVNLQ